jgi:antirestriction protein
MNTQDNTPKIYVGTYSKYNNGSIFGKWFDLSDYSDKDEFIEACLELHNDEEDPELMFQDYENIPESFISESHIDDEFWPFYEEFSQMDENRQEALLIFSSDFGYKLTDSDIIEKFEESYQGEWNSEEDFAQNLFNELYLHEVPEFMQYYIDYEKFSRDLFMGDYSYYNGHVFNRNI